MPLKNQRNAAPDRPRIPIQERTLLLPSGNSERGSSIPRFSIVRPDLESASCGGCEARARVGAFGSDSKSDRSLVAARIATRMRRRPKDRRAGESAARDKGQISKRKTKYRPSDADRRSAEKGAERGREKVGKGKQEAQAQAGARGSLVRSI